MFERFKRSPIESLNKIWLGTAALGVVIALVAAVLLFGALGIGETKYQAEFAQAASLRAGEQVTIAGISVGTVDGLKLAGDRVIVTFNVSNDVHLGRDTQAAIKLTTLLGSRYLELSPAGNGELPDDTIPLSNTSVPYDLQQTLADATTTFGEIDAERIAQSLTTLTQNLHGVPEALPEALRNLKSLSAILAERRDQLRTLLSSTHTVTAMIRDQRANLGSLVLQGRDLLGELTSRRAAVQRLFASATALVDTLKRVLDDEPALNELLVTMRELSTMIADHDALLRNILQVLPVPIRNVANATGSGPAADATFPNLPLVDSWMCAISGRAQQFNLVEYFQDCQ
ncbi:putative MCE family protein [Mycobacterium sp. shizuoka-1]|jgi:phospholipid/cholesterol/gamma-HCH transport system substrate-binding protein|nr:MCE family protein [Mycobacterium sp. shizuoka-1]GAY13874.1 putative MCE family protein [Mycobacterium sp. shizuoka-1]